MLRPGKGGTCLHVVAVLESVAVAAHDFLHRVAVLALLAFDAIPCELELVLPAFLVLLRLLFRQLFRVLLFLLLIVAFVDRARAPYWTARRPAPMLATISTVSVSFLMASASA